MEVQKKAVIVEVDCNWSPDRLQAVLATLPQQVQARANRYLSDRAKRTLLASQWALRSVLDHLEIPQSHLAICPKGRPYLSCGSLEFNISHSQNRAVLLFGQGSVLKEKLGVDVECCSRVVEKDALAQRFFTESEYLYTKESDLNFFRIWTRKEAVLKTNGIGLRVPLNSFQVLADTVAEEVTGSPLVLGTEPRPDGHLVSWALPEDWRGTKIHWVTADTDDWLIEVSEGIGA